MNKSREDHTYQDDLNIQVAYSRHSYLQKYAIVSAQILFDGRESTSTFLRLRALSTSSAVRTVLFACRIHLMASWNIAWHIELIRNNTRSK
jgi:hypothetical protein